MSSRQPAREWAVVVPIKGGSGAKSRLEMAPEARERLARAFARHTVAAALASAAVDSVTVVTGDPAARADAEELGANLIAEPIASIDPTDPTGPLEATDALNRAILAGIAAAGPDRPTAVLLGDLPALTPGELTAALAAAAGHPLAFVPDAEGTGTVLLTARRGDQLRPRFGGASARAHEDAGYRRLELDLPGLRRDVDEIAHLDAAISLVARV